MSLINIHNEINNINKNKNNNNLSLDKTELYINLLELFDKTNIDLYFYSIYKYKYDIDKDEIKNKRVGQILFRKKVVDRYKVCIISGSSEIVCEACHIINYSECLTNDKYNQNNGLLFRRDLHILFDKHKLKIDIETLTVKLSDDILTDINMSKYIKYNNKPIYIHPESIIYLKELYKYI